MAPAITLLIGVFADGIDLHRKKKVDKVRHLNFMMQDSHNKIKGQSREKTSHLRQSIRKNDEQKSTLQKEINLLSPKRQVIRVFGSLTLSLALIVVYDLFVIYHFSNGFLSLKTAILTTSVISFSYSLFCLWQIFCIIIDLKHIDSAEAFGKQKKVEINQEDLL